MIIVVFPWCTFCDGKSKSMTKEILSMCKLILILKIGTSIGTEQKTNDYKRFEKHDSSKMVEID